MMSKTPLHLRPASAAIAAVLALSTTVAIAQDGAPAPADALAAPVIVPVDPIAPETRPADTALPDAAPTNALPEPLRAPSVTSPTSPSMDTTAPAEVPSLSRPLPPVEPAPQTERPDRPRVTSATTRTPVRTAPTTRAATVAIPAAAAVTGVQPLPPQDLPPSDAIVSPLPADPALVAVQAAPADDGGLAEWALFGGLVGIGGIAAAAALSRRRRPEPEPEPQGTIIPHEIVPTISPTAAKTSVNPQAPRPPVASASVATLAHQARLSPRQGVGRHEAMVDAGPTPDNPFVTRRKRLARARFLDQQEAASGVRFEGEDEARPRYAAR